MKEQVEVRELKEGRYVIIDDEPCIIKAISHSKPGKHGSAKARVDAIGIFDGQKRSVVNPVTAKKRPDSGAQDRSGSLGKR